jgi:hypothetical protein
MRKRRSRSLIFARLLTDAFFVENRSVVGQRARCADSFGCEQKTVFLAGAEK